MQYIQKNGDSIVSPYLFEDKLSIEDIKKLKPLFCVKSLEETKCLCYHMRPLCIIETVAQELNMTQDLNENNIKNLYGLKVGFVHRPRDEYGNKINSKLIVTEGIIEKIENYSIFVGGGVYIKCDNLEYKNVPISVKNVFLL